MTGGAAIFVKTPGLSPLKTRLATTIGTEAAVAWYRLAASATAAALAQVPGLSSYWAVAEPAPQASAAWPGLPCIAQGGGPLGARMGRVHSALVERHGCGILLGADTPQVDPIDLARAAAWLDDPTPRLVMGPSRDGGFWLIGANRVLPATVWTRAPCSRDDTAAGFRAAMSPFGAWLDLPTLTDVDEATDLAVMLAEMSRLDAPLAAQCNVIDASKAHLG